MQKWEYKILAVEGATVKYIDGELLYKKKEEKKSIRTLLGKVFNPSI